jgi:hypothetical protein
MGEDLIAISECPPGHEFWQWFFELRCKLAEAEEGALTEQDRIIATIGAVRDFARHVAGVPEFSREFSFLQKQTAELGAALSELSQGIDHPFFARQQAGNKHRHAMDRQKMAVAAAIVEVAGRRNLDQKKAADVISDVMKAAGFVTEGKKVPTVGMILEWRKKCKRTGTNGDLPQLFQWFAEKLDNDRFPSSDNALADYIRRLPF